jgi:hypothetical protein
MGWDPQHHTLICHHITQSVIHRDRDSNPSFHPQHLTNPIPPSPSPPTHHRLDQTFTATCPESERLDLQSWTCSLIAVCVQKLSLEEMAPVTGMYSCSTYCTYCLGLLGCLCSSLSFVICVPYQSRRTLFCLFFYFLSLRDPSISASTHSSLTTPSLLHIPSQIASCSCCCKCSAREERREPAHTRYVQHALHAHELSASFFAL